MHQGIQPTAYRRLSTIFSEIEFKPFVSLNDVKDSKHAEIPRACKIHQIAIRRRINKPGVKTFLINKDIWDRMSPLNQAGLVLHEIIYEHFFYLGEKDSQKARYLNGLLVHIGAKGKLPRPYSELLQELKIPIYR